MAKKTIKEHQGDPAIQTNNVKLADKGMVDDLVKNYNEKVTVVINLIYTNSIESVYCVNNGIDYEQLNDYHLSIIENFSKRKLQMFRLIFDNMQDAIFNISNDIQNLYDASNGRGVEIVIYDSDSTILFKSITASYLQYEADIADDDDLSSYLNQF